EERPIYAEATTSEINRTTQHTPHHVAALFIRRRHRRAFVSDEERDGTRVLGDDADGAICRRVFAVALARKLLDAADDGLEEVCVVDRRGPVLVPLRSLEQEDGGHALQAGAGVNVLRWQRRAFLAVAVVGHED